MSVNPSQESLSRQLAESVVASEYPEYSSYLDDMWRATVSHLEAGEKPSSTVSTPLSLSGADPIVAEIVEVLIPFCIQVAAIVSGELIYHRIASRRKRIRQIVEEIVGSNPRAKKYSQQVEEELTRGT